MARIHISNDPSGHISVSFPYAPLLVARVKTIDGRRWYPAEKHWSFLNTPSLFIDEEGGGEEVRIACLSGRQQLSPKFNPSSKTTEIYTHVSTKSLGKIMSPLDTLELAKGGDE
jgi:hypothetical protein